MKNKYFRKDFKQRKQYRVKFTKFEVVMMATNLGIIGSIWITFILN